MARPLISRPLLSKASRRYLQTAPPLYPNSSVLSYSLGISYASKDSPPFIPPQQKPKPYGFANDPKYRSEPISSWVREMLDLDAGRGELLASEKGGWGPALVDERKKWGAGEDFFAIAKSGKDIHLALSDGVGGWSSTVDPSLFSQALMYHYHTSLFSLSHGGAISAHPQEVLKAAYQSLLNDPNVKAGGGTAVGLRLKEDGEALFSNLGDSGYAILRNDQIKVFSNPQTHYFNCPVQLSKIPPSMRSSGIIHDTPDQAEVKSFDLQPGDVVILYTDGLSDNLPKEHIPLLSSSLTRLLNAEVNSHLTPLEQAKERARLFSDILVGYGRMAMTRTGDEEGWKTPFELEAKKLAPQYQYKGGKVDDITVITAVVSELD